MTTFSGYTPIFDERSRLFSITELIGDRRPRSYTWRCDLHLNQKKTSACTGFAVCHEAAADPVPVPKLTAAIAQEVYARAKKLDQYYGENYAGSSVLGAIKAGAERGWYASYRWAFSEYDLRIAVGWQGPAVIGIPWTKDMRTPDTKTGVIKPTGVQIGRHALMVKGFNITTGMYRLHNSYGTGWGLGGDCYLHYTHMAQLLKQQGECCIPISRKLKK